jgi:hypothetical protein
MKTNKLSMLLSNTRLKYRKFVTIAMLSTLILFMSNEQSLAETLRTENYTVTITRNCSQENVTCDNVTYYGTSLTGESIRLTGRTAHKFYLDRQSGEELPGRFLGYLFLNGEYRYFVGASGRLIVYQGETMILDEQGTWLNPGRDGG